MNNKTIFLCSVLVISFLSFGLGSSFPVQADSKAPRTQNNGSVITEKQKKVDAYTLRKWKEGLRHNPQFNIHEIASQIPFILSNKQEQSSYFERMESFIPTDPNLMIGVDSNIHWQDLSELASSAADYAQDAAKHNDLLQCRDALLLIPNIVMRPINLVPTNEVMYVGHKTPGYKVHSFAWLPALFGIFYLKGAFVSIKPYIKNSQSLVPISKDIESVIKQLKDNTQKEQKLIDQLKDNSPEMEQIMAEKKNILLKFMISIKPKIELAFQLDKDKR